MTRLSRDFYTHQDSISAARALLGKTLFVRSAEDVLCAAKICETEAYQAPEDRASHAFGGRRTARTEIFYAEGGRAYVYLIYGMYLNLNVIVGAENVPHCVLIRAVEPVLNIEAMRERRKTAKDKNLTSGPGKLTIALGVNKSFYGEDFCTSERIWIEDAPAVKDSEIACGKRIGIEYAAEYAEKLWRFWIKDNPFVSR